MVDTSMIYVRAFYEHYVTLAGTSSRVWRTGEVEYHSNCPWCGGYNRFAFWSSSRYSCSIRARGCGRYGRDVIDFLREYEGLSFCEACDELGIDPGRAYTSLMRHRVAADEEPPPKAWQDRAAAVIHHAQRFLWSPRGQGALDYLRHREFTDDTICTAALGYIPYTGDGRWYRDAPEHWGLSQEDEPMNGVWLPEGILIPWYADGHIWKLHIRRLSWLKDGDAKYVQVKGSREGLYNVDTIRVDTPLVVCEGEFDALAGQQRCSDVASWVATGATTRARRDRWLARMGMASSVLVAYDEDVPDRSGKRAGEEGVLYWERTLPHALRWPPWMHDVNEMVQQGHDLRTWIELGLAVAAIALAPTAVGGYRVHQRGQDVDLPGEVGSDDQQTISSANNVLKENVHVTYERLQGVNRVQTPFGPGVIYPYTPLLIQVQRGRVGVLLDNPVHENGRRLEYFFANVVSSAHASL
ncbi:MAG TPA: hypothetical protein VFN02_09455 [Ktedonobacteraceae bacterium]|nr:hypothetical protein [Ktedonobacteraceae bacterium]